MIHARVPPRRRQRRPREREMESETAGACDGTGASFPLCNPPTAPTTVGVVTVAACAPEKASTAARIATRRGWKGMKPVVGERGGGVFTGARRGYFELRSESGTHRRGMPALGHRELSCVAASRTREGVLGFCHFVIVP